MSDRMRKGKDRAQVSPAAGAEPLHSHIRELAPRTPEEIVKDSPSDEQKPKAERGFFAQAARISMGTAFPALRSVARFLSLESYRSLPKLDRLPELDDDVVEANLDDIQESPEEERPTPAEQLLDWDELEIEELAATPYRLYLFDIRIQDYLRQTKQELAPLLLVDA